MSDWVRALFRTAGASREWHAARSKGLTTVTYCEENIAGPLEIAREDKAEREGRCSRCATLVVAPRGMAPLRAMAAVPTAPRADLRATGRGPARDTPRRPEAQVRQVGAKQGTAKIAIKKPVGKQALGKAAGAKRAVGRSRREST